MATTQCFATVFDASDHPPLLQFAVLGLGPVLVAIGIALLIFRQTRVVQAVRRGLAEYRPILVHGSYTQVVIVMFVFGFLLTVGAASALSDWWSVNFGRADVVEGTVEQFHPPASPHDSEHFVVSGVRFDYSDYRLSSGFNRTSSNGGPIRSGLRVRIHWVSLESGPTISKLEVAC